MSQKPRARLRFWAKVMCKYREPFTEDQISLIFTAKILDILVDAGLLKKTLESGVYLPTNDWSPEQADEIVKTYIQQQAKRLGIDHIDL